MSTWLLRLVLFIFPLFLWAQPKSTVIVLSDGMGIGMINFKLNYDEYVRKKKSGLRDFLVSGSLALVQTSASDFLVTDSAAGATALFCGLKTRKKSCGLDANGQPCETIAEKAKKKGKKIGVVTTDEVLEATPAAFASHGKRDDWQTLAKGLLKTRPEVLIGGGKSHFSSDLFEKAGYAVFVDSSSAFQAKDETKPMAVLLHEEALPFPSKDASMPHLKDLTKIALKRLSQGSQGFFLLLENEWTDSAGHAKDPRLVLEAMDELESALEVLLPLAKEGKINLYLTADHDTGGLAMAANVSKFGLPEVQDLSEFKKIFWVSSYHTDLPVLFVKWPRLQSGPSLLDNTEAHKILLEAL